jgi:CheY-like chemotaxis protein
MIRQTYKVLVVDDDEAVRESLRKLLHGEGYQVIAVSNGVEAMETFRQEVDQIDLLLVDLNMPMKNGWATLDQLIEVNPLLPVLIITGQPNQKEMAQAAGVSALVEKPIDVPALLKLIQELMAGPVQSRLPRAIHREFPFHHLRAAGYASRYSWKEQNASPYRCGGLNE